MENSDFEDTQPNQVNPTDLNDSSNQDKNLEATKPTLVSSNEDDTLPTQVEVHKQEKKSGSRWLLITLVGFSALLMIAVLSAWTGYRSGINLRTEAESTQLAGVASAQYELALVDLQEGRYDRARQRLEYVIKLDPSYPGATDKLAEVLLLINATATPTSVPTATVAPTPDTSQTDEIDALFNQGEQQLLNEDWSGAIDTLLKVRKLDPTYKMIQIDGMLFIALRNQGINKILKEGDLEGGVYDLALAKNFGPLDTEAEGVLTWAKLYITGASFWELDWQQAIYYFSQVAPQLPGLRDASGMTASERYRLAIIGYGDTLLAAGKPCQAMEQYQLALSMGNDADAEASLAQAIKGCEGGNKKEQPSNNQPPPSGGSSLPQPGQEPTAYPSP